MQELAARSSNGKERNSIKNATESLLKKSKGDSNDLFEKEWKKIIFST